MKSNRVVLSWCWPTKAWLFWGWADWFGRNTICWKKQRKEDTKKLGWQAVCCNIYIRGYFLGTETISVKNRNTVVSKAEGRKKGPAKIEGGVAWTCQVCWESVAMGIKWREKNVSLCVELLRRGDIHQLCLTTPKVKGIPPYCLSSAYQNNQTVLSFDSPDHLKGFSCTSRIQWFLLGWI